VGLFVVGAIVLAVFSVMVLGSGKLFRDTVPFVVYFDASVAGLDVGAPVKFRGVPVGTVREIAFRIPGEERRFDDYRIPVVFEIDQGLIRHRGGRVDLSNEALVDSMIAEGFRAQMALESFVTGKRYIALDVLPDTEVFLEAELGGDYKEIPVVAAAEFDVLQAQIQRILAEIEASPIDSMFIALTEAVQSMERVSSTQLPETMEALEEALESIHQLVTRADGRLDGLADNLDTVSQSLTATLDEMRLTMADLRNQMAPGSPITHRLVQTLAELENTARAFRVLAEYLEQNPGALVRGKEVEDKQ
jgi:paraquat-inducible protein B